jgi:hypothetical protein
VTGRAGRRGPSTASAAVSATASAAVTATGRLAHAIVCRDEDLRSPGKHLYP